MLDVGGDHLDDVGLGASSGGIEGREVVAAATEEEQGPRQVLLLAWEADHVVGRPLEVLDLRPHRQRPFSLADVSVHTYMKSIS